MAEIQVINPLGSNVAVVSGTGIPVAAIANVATANADATYGQPEADLINELKTKLNSVLAALRTAGIVAT